MKYRIILFILLVLQVAPGATSPPKRRCLLSMALLSRVSYLHVDSIEFQNRQWVAIQTDNRKEISSVEPLRAKLEQLMYNHAANHNVNSDRLQFYFGLAFQEVYTNAVLHGNKQDPNKTIFIRYSAGRDKFVLEIADQGGDFFDPQNKADPRNALRDDGTIEGDAAVTALQKRRKDANLGREGEGGRGVLISGGIADKPIYKPTRLKNKKSGTHVILTWDFKVERWEIETIAEDVLNATE